MKTCLLRTCTFGAALLLLSLLGGCSPQASNAPPPATNAPSSSNPTPVAQAEAAPVAGLTNGPDTLPSAPPTLPPDASTVSTVPANPTMTGSLPPDILPHSPLAQVIQLAQAGVDESVIMTYITNSTSTFNLDPEKIIYLKDIGLPNGVATAMMQRDRQLQQQMAASAYQPPAQPAPTPETTEAPEVAPVETGAAQPPEPVNITYNYFYDLLAPYGSWVEVEGYGRCWRPTIMIYNPGWQPYCDHGHWVYTDCGWYWISDYSWGWATFHYGRWFRHPRWSWCWWPDTTWAPSWVCWRQMNDYCGWAPLPPRALYRPGVGFVFNGRAVGVGFDFGLDVGCFTFVPTRRFCDPHPRRYRIAATQATQIYNRTTVINNLNFNNHTIVNDGIPPRAIAAVTGTEIHPITIREGGGSVAGGEQLGRDGRTLFVNRLRLESNPAPPGAPPHPEATGRNNFLQANPNWGAFQSMPASRTESPRATLRGPQNRNETVAPNQPTAPPANYFPPRPAETAPAPNNRVFSPRGQQQFESSQPPQSSAAPRNEPQPIYSAPPPPPPHSQPQQQQQQQQQQKQ
jgi:hypothetical protein